MNTDNWFDDLPMLGQMPPAQAAAKLREVGEDEVADAIENAQFKVTTDSTKFGILEDLGWRPKLWFYIAHIPLIQWRWLHRQETNGESSFVLWAHGTSL